MEVDKTNNKAIPNQTFVQDQEVMVRRLGDGMEYRAKIVGHAVDLPEYGIYIVELLDPMTNQKWTHITMTAACIDQI